MPGAGPYTQLPKDIVVSQAPVDYAALTAVTSVSTDVAVLNVTNITSADINFTLTNFSASAAYSALIVSPGYPATFTFDPPLHFDGGVKWLATSAGLQASLQGRTRGGFTQGSATPQSNNLPIPA